MDKAYYYEMINNIDNLERKITLKNKNIYLFGHCNATEELADVFEKKGYEVKGIFDNNISKQGSFYKKIPILLPTEILKETENRAIVCVVSRAYAPMSNQLKKIGFTGMIVKLIDYNSFAEYSLEKPVIEKMENRLKRGLLLLEQAKEKYPEYFKIYCPFQALGDVYNVLAYLPHYLKKNNIGKFVVYVVGKACYELVKMFGIENAENINQNNMDEHIQAVLYTDDKYSYVVHNDRPYIIDISKVLKIKKIPHEMLYKYGAFGLSDDCVPYKPQYFKESNAVKNIAKNKSVILSPYAKSIANISEKYWEKIIKYYSEKEYQLFTNVVGDEQALPNTERLEVKISELQPIIEYAGTFIGLRSGLCDVIKTANCRKIALYPDCYYSDTKWKVEEMFHLDGWENIVLENNFHKSNF